VEFKRYAEGRGREEGGRREEGGKREGRRREEGGKREEGENHIPSDIFKISEINLSWLTFRSRS
jgi:hypothetical protein